MRNRLQARQGRREGGYTDNYKLNGTNIDTTTTYFYHIPADPDAEPAVEESDLARAADANADSYMTKSVTLRSDDSTKQISYFTGTEAGEEAIDWSQEYNFDGTLVKTTTIYTHDADGALTKSTVYKDDTVRTLKPEDLTVKKSETFYKLGKGDEKADYTDNYKLNGTNIDTTTTYFYHIPADPDAEPAVEESDLARAEDANADSYMTKSVTLRSDDSTKQISYFTGTEAGEEAIDWSQEYNFDGTLVKTTTIYTHDADGALTKSTVYKDDTVRTLKPEDLTVKKSETFYKLGKGDEKADYTDNYKLNGTNIDTTTTYFYHIPADPDAEPAVEESDLARAADANADSYMTKSVTLRSDDSTKQISYFTGTEAGEEAIDWSQEYNFDGTLVKTTTIYTHDADGALTKSTVYKDDTVRTLKPEDLTIKKIETFYKLGKGDEKADYTDNYKVNGTNIDTTTTYFYHIPADADAEPAVEESDLARAETQTPTPT